jgi:hypothetical protein
MQNTLIIFHAPFYFPFPFPLVPFHIKQDLFYLLILHFLKCILIVKWGSAMVCVYCSLIKLTPFVIYSFSITMLPYCSTSFSTFLYTIFICIYKVFWYYSLYHSLFLSHLPLVSSDRPTIAIMFSHSLYIYVYLYVYTHVYTIVYMYTFNF